MFFLVVLATSWNIFYVYFRVRNANTYAIDGWAQDRRITIAGDSIALHKAIDMTNVYLCETNHVLGDAWGIILVAKPVWNYDMDEELHPHKILGYDFLSIP